VTQDLIGGDGDEDYGKVADAFRRNLVSGKESVPLSRYTAMAARSSMWGRRPPEWEDPSVLGAGRDRQRLLGRLGS
jgi:hypothetical protein